MRRCGVGGLQVQQLVLAAAVRFARTLRVTATLGCRSAAGRVLHSIYAAGRALCNAKERRSGTCQSHRHTRVFAGRRTGIRPGTTSPDAPRPGVARGSEPPGESAIKSAPSRERHNSTLAAAAAARQARPESHLYSQIRRSAAPHLHRVRRRQRAASSR